MYLNCLLNLIQNIFRYISPNQWSQILRYGVEYGGKKEWDFAWQQYNLTGDTEYLIAMIKTRQTKNIEK